LEPSILLASPYGAVPVFPTSWPFRSPVNAFFGHQDGQ